MSCHHGIQDGNQFGMDLFNRFDFTGFMAINRRVSTQLWSEIMQTIDFVKYSSKNYNLLVLCGISMMAGYLADVKIAFADLMRHPPGMFIVKQEIIISIADSFGWIWIIAH